MISCFSSIFHRISHCGLTSYLRNDGGETVHRRSPFGRVRRVFDGPAEEVVDAISATSSAIWLPL